MTQIDQQLLLALKNNLQTASQLISGMLVSDIAGSAPFDVLMRTSAIPHVRLSEALSVLEIFQEFQLIRKVENSFFNIYSPQKLGALQQTILGAQIYKKFADDILEQEKSEVVLTRPKAPSSLDKQIDADPSLLVHIENTDDAFASIAASATKSLTIMTPFLDEVGASWAITLYEIAKSTVSKELILRFLQDPNSDLYPKGLDRIKPDLIRLGVKVYDFAVPRPDSRNFFETFHAKVICADGDRAYVGSANLSRHSKETSMELGMLVSGSAAARVNAILEKVRRIAISTIN